MNWFNNLTITKKLLVSFSFVGIISISINSYIFIEISAAYNKSDKIINKWLPGLVNINEIYNIISNLKVNENKLVYKSLNKENYSNELNQIQNDLNRLNKNELDYLSIERDSSELKLFKEYKTIYDNYIDYLNKYIINSKIKEVYKNSINF